MPKEIINSLAAVSKVCAMLLADFKEHKYIRVSWSTSKDRTLDQNALWAAMYKRISQTTGEPEQSIKSDCKLLIGVNILYRDSEEYRRIWDGLMGHLSYEQQLWLMGPNKALGKDGYPVTREFDTKQGVEYTEAITRQYGPLGVFFDDLLSN